MRSGDKRMIKIKHKITGEVLKVVEADNLRDANLGYADLRGADLSFADLRDAKGEFIFNWGVKLKVVEIKE
jgi:uncharacterized protein YjbI with pentapeptide repeats